MATVIHILYFPPPPYPHISISFLTDTPQAIYSLLLLPHYTHKIPLKTTKIIFERKNIQKNLHTSNKTPTFATQKRRNPSEKQKT